MRLANRLETRLLVTVCGVAAASIAICAWANIHRERTERLRLMVRSADQFSDTIKRSVHHAMRQNRWTDAFHTMESIGQQEGVHKVRVFAKTGAILFSTDRTEVGRIVDRQAESCHACHAPERPLERLDLPERTRIFSEKGGGRLLGMITPILNEPGCSEGCHVHPPHTRVLGVLDVTLSLASLDAELAAAARRTTAFAATTILALALILAALLRRNVIRPVHALVDGTRRVAQGDLDYRLPAAAPDELGELSRSFNSMAEALSRARADVTGVMETLEQRVDERTRALQTAQTQLLQAEKLASLGRLSASIAHEINNPLMGILTCAKLAARRLGGVASDQGEVKASLQQLALIVRETQRCSAIVRHLLDFARQRAPSFQPVDVHALLEEALSLVAHRLGMQNIEVTRTAETVPPVRADAGQLRQALLNILINACDAMPEGGNLCLEVHRAGPLPSVESDPGPASADASCLPGAIRCIIGDTGRGIPAEHLSRIFDPFFTTKDMGTGLGLSVVHGIMQNHGGTIAVESRVGMGTTVTLCLPAAPAEPQ
jgi:two-component system, NtrC family, sensor kinase